MKEAVNNTDDVIDGRDIIERLNELKDMIGEERCDTKEERLALEALAEEADNSPDFPHGEALIRDSYFTKYAQELAEDIGAIDRDADWPLSHIDWEGAANALKVDYISVDFDGVEYWIRA